MNLSRVLEFLLFVYIAPDYVTCCYFNWAKWHQYDDSTRKITGGTPISTEGQFPYLVSFRFPTGDHKCGGSILNERYVLTAAHCINESNPSSIQYGSLKVDPYGPNVVSVERIIIHEDYNSDLFFSDIAILKLAEDIKFGEQASPVSLPYQDEDIPKSDDMFVIGWGVTHHDNEDSPNHALYAKISSFSDEYCSQQEQNFNSTYQSCGGVLEGGRGQCSGDSGGPVIINGKQYGIVSWSNKPCASPGNPGVFTRVPTYRIWIYKHTGI